MKFIFRWAFRLLILAVVLGIGIILTKDKLLKEYVASSVRQSTGMDIRIGSFETGVLHPTVHLENVTVYNTAEFGGSPFLVIPDLYLEYDRQSAGLQRLQLPLVRLEIAELHVIENEKGQTNLYQLLGKIGTALPAEQKGVSSSENKAFRGIDRLNLTVHKVKYTNLRNPRRSQEIPIQLKNEVINNLRTQEDFFGVLLKVFLRAGIPLYLDDKATLPASRGSLMATPGKNG